MHRRTFVAGVSTLAAAGLAGCTGLVGDDPIEFEASPVGASDDALAETGYEFAELEDVVVERTFEAAGQSQEVVVTNRQAEYEKAIDFGPLGEQRAALFTVLSTPQVEVVGQEFNPVADMDTRELVETVQDGYDGLENIEPIGTADVTILDQETTQERFEAEADFDGTTVDVYLHVSEAVETAEDLVITVGAYPQQTDGEEDNVLRLMEGVDPDATLDGSDGGGSEDGGDADDGGDTDDSGDSDTDDDGDTDDDDGVLGGGAGY